MTRRLMVTFHLVYLGIRLAQQEDGALRVIKVEDKIVKNGSSVEEASDMRVTCYVHIHIFWLNYFI